MNRYGAIEDFPPDVLGERRELALLFKKLATLKTDAPLFRDVEELRWRGPTPTFASWTERMEAPRLLERCHKLAAALDGGRGSGRRASSGAPAVTSVGEIYMVVLASS